MTEERIDLNGVWELTYSYPEGGDEGTIEAMVPGNVELDLARAGLLPKDLFFGTNITLAEKYEPYDWRFVRHFDCPDPGKKYRLVFCGVDCAAEYVLNGRKIGTSRNMLVEHVFEVDGLLEKDNVLEVNITSSMKINSEHDLSLRVLSWKVGCDPLRRPAHSYGWDIMPRAVSAGIWKDVYLEPVPEVEFRQLYMMTPTVTPEWVAVAASYELSPNMYDCRNRNVVVVFDGKCGDSEFHKEERIYSRAGVIDFRFTDPKLWEPKNYGEPNLYDVTARLVEDGRTLCEKRLRLGVRTLRLVRRDPESPGDRGEFVFRVNGKEIFAMGSNWVPLSPYHSQDKSRLGRALDLLDECGCNIVRCWGGNVYESDEFYDFCDEHGILVWQDFSFACHDYPVDENILREIADEAKKVIKRLRGHACLALWCGDNEIDTIDFWNGYDPENNIINRGVLRLAVAEHDRFRDYIPSSPYVTRTVYETKNQKLLVEDHLWGERNYYKDPYYAESPARFVSETGFHGCVSRETALEFVPEEDLVTRRSEALILHSTDNYHNYNRFLIMDRQIRNTFGAVPDDFDTFARLSQLIQAEGCKFMLENARSGRGGDRGVIWWNLLDGWPQISDAVVDYYFRRKAAYDVIKRSQQPVLLLVNSDMHGRYRLYGSDDTDRDVTLDFTVTDAESGELLAKGLATMRAGERKEFLPAPLPNTFAEQRLLIIRWSGDATGVNHFFTGKPTYDGEWFDKMYKIVEALR